MEKPVSMKKWKMCVIAFQNNVVEEYLYAYSMHYMDKSLCTPDPHIHTSVCLLNI